MDVLGTECGTGWGWEDDAESTSYPMTPELYKQWYGRWQAGAMRAFTMEDVFGDEWADRYASHLSEAEQEIASTI